MTSLNDMTPLIMNILFIFFFLIEAMYITGHNTKDSFNILMKDSAVYSIDEFLTSDDYEMIESNDEKMKNINQLLGDLNKLAREEYEKTLNSCFSEEFNDISSGNYIQYSTTSDIHITKHVISKRDALLLDDESDYDYKELLNDYIAADIRDDFTESEEEKQHVGYKEIISIFKNIVKHPTKITLTQVWVICRIWLFVYLAIAVPLWCTKGWCCCCLGSRLFKPKRSIEEAKGYFLRNPPGLLIVPNVGVIRYEATESEKDSYEKFGHVLRTI